MKTKYYLFLTMALMGTFAFFGGSAKAITNCDNQPKPAFDCPTGYSMMCIPIGGDHWGCGKESNGVIIELSAGGSAKADGVKSTLQTQVRVQDSDASAKENANEDKKDSSGVEVNSERVLPTVNKKTIEAKVTVRGWDADKKEAIDARVRAELEDNSQIRSVDIAEDQVSMDYSVPAKLFGFIPMQMGMRIFADANARVTVKFPWYKFMVKTSVSNAAEMLNEVFQQNQTDLEFLRSAPSEDRQLQIFIRISNTMEQTL